jgi:hypothetical protein
MLARRTRFLRTPGLCRSQRPHPEGVSRNSVHPVRGADVACTFIPGVRKKRVPLAKLLAPHPARRYSFDCAGFNVSFCTRQFVISPTYNSFSLRQSIS